MQAGGRQEMKRIRAEVASPSASESSGKAPRRQKAPAAPKSGRAKKGNAARKGIGEGQIPNAASAPDAQDSSRVPSAPVAEELVLAGWADGTAEVGDLLWPLGGIEEEKLSGWFPFVDADFLCPEICQGEEFEGLGDHDIWQLQHIHEIPQRASK